MKHLFAALLTVLVVAHAPAPAQAQAITTEWMTSSQFQGYFQSQVQNNNLIMTYLEAEEFHGQLYYYATFESLPPGIGWAMYHGLSDASFQSRSQQMASQGYRMVHHQRFVGSSGRVANQAIWYR